MKPSVQSDSQGRIGTRGREVAAAAVAFGLGLFLLWGAGFANPQVLHNAAHDTRHAFSFPCH